MNYIFIAFSIWFSFRYLLPLILPMVLAGLVVIPSASVIRRINRRLHIGKGILTGGLLILIVFILLLFVWMVIGWTIGNLSSLLRHGDRIWEQVSEMICEGCEIVEEQTGVQQGTITAMIDEQGNLLLSDFQKSLLPKVMTGSMKSVRSIINVIVTLLITSLAAVLLAKDYETIKTAVMNWKDIQIIGEIFRKIGNMLVSYVKAQGIIYLVIAGICMAGLFLAGMSHPIQTALITAFLDVLPFIGTGIVLGPLAVWYLLNRQFWKVLICAGIYLLCILARQTMEPRLIGKNVGIFPVIILISIYAGIKLYGLGGVILGPLSFLLFQEIVRIYRQYAS